MSNCESAIKSRASLLNLLRTRKQLEGKLGPDVEVEWLQFAAGPQMLEALNVGSIDFGTSGEAPPVFAQAAGAPLVYVALERVGPRAEALLVRPNSSYRSLGDLRGKRIALNKGSNVHYFLIRGARIGRPDLSRHQPRLFAAGRRARLRGRTGGCLGDLGSVRSRGHRSGSGPRAVGWHRPGRELSILSFDGAVGGSPTADCRKRREQAAQSTIGRPAIATKWPAFYLACSSLTKRCCAVAERRHKYGIEAIGPETIAYQQRIADTFTGLKLIPGPIRVADAVWKPQ